MGDRGATTTVLVQSLRLQCGAREAHAALREYFVHPVRGALVSGTTQLMRAAMLNNLPRVLQLIQLGAPLDLVDSTGSSALVWASELGHEHIVKALLDGKYEGRGSTVDLRDFRGLTPLMRASLSGQEAAVRVLLDAGARMELQATEGSTALHSAIFGGHSSIVAQLCAAPGFTVAAFALRFGGSTPLEYAINFNQRECEAALRARGAYV